MVNPDVIIVGSGISGLSCAFHLHRNGISALVLESSDGIGGRLRTDSKDGFLLDRGFQVLLTAYPEAKAVLNYEALNLHYFAPGALVRFDERFHRLVDPWRLPLKALSVLFSPLGSLSDKLRIARLRHQATSGSIAELFQRPESTALETLKGLGFSENMINRFFRPFLGGVFFDSELSVSSRMFEFGFRMFSQGGTALPAAGMVSLPQQIASRLPEESIRTNAKVTKLQEKGVLLASGEAIFGKAVVLATEGPEVARLLEEKTIPASRSMTCCYFSALEPPLSEPLLVLNGEGKGPIVNCCVPSIVAPSYAPAGKSLIAATIIGVPMTSEQAIVTAVKNQLSDWFGPSVDTWELLRIYKIHHALPLQTPPTPNPLTTSVKKSSWLFYCGEYRSLASLHWALVSGRRASERVLEALNR
ncbi:MAG: FAD-dependent oxidoreductase [Deltaproteobacteria bacterium]|nr:FAD-dependent oxidoreductase [Deltaproteobacteria bacterium]